MQSLNKLHSEKSKINIPRIATASLIGAAGGVTLISAFPVAGTAQIIASVSGSLIGAAVTGFSEYKREKKSDGSELPGRKKWEAK